jgi:hypothetical protein
LFEKSCLRISKLITINSCLNDWYISTLAIQLWNCAPIPARSPFAYPSLSGYVEGHWSCCGGGSKSRYWDPTGYSIEPPTVEYEYSLVDQLPCWSTRARCRYGDVSIPRLEVPKRTCAAYFWTLYWRELKSSIEVMGIGLLGIACDLALEPFVWCWGSSE